MVILYETWGEECSCNWNWMTTEHQSQPWRQTFMVSLNPRSYTNHQWNQDSRIKYWTFSYPCTVPICNAASDWKHHSDMQTSRSIWYSLWKSILQIFIKLRTKDFWFDQHQARNLRLLWWKYHGYATSKPLKNSKGKCSNFRAFGCWEIFLQSSNRREDHRAGWEPTFYGMTLLTAHR